MFSDFIIKSNEIIDNIIALSKYDKYFLAIPAINTINDPKHYKPFDPIEFSIDCRVNAAKLTLYHLSRERKIKGEISSLTDLETRILGHSIQNHNLPKKFNLKQELKTLGYFKDIHPKIGKKGVYQITLNRVESKATFIDIFENVWPPQPWPSIIKSRSRSTISSRQQLCLIDKLKLNIKIYNEIHNIDFSKLAGTLDENLLDLTSNYANKINLPLIRSNKENNELVIFIESLWYNNENRISLHLHADRIKKIQNCVYENYFRLKHYLRECKKLCNHAGRHAYLFSMILKLPNQPHEFSVITIITFSRKMFDLYRSKQSPLKKIEKKIREEATLHYSVDYSPVQLNL